MASRRMFSQAVVGSDSFLDMPVSVRELYFHLGMHADDDGFVSPKGVTRMINASEDDLKILVAKGFVIPFESGIACIRHWKQNNYLRKDRYTITAHIAEKAMLAERNHVYGLIKDGYTSGIPVGIPAVNPGRKEGRKEEGQKSVEEAEEELVRVEPTEAEIKYQKIRSEMTSLFHPNK